MLKTILPVPAPNWIAEALIVPEAAAAEPAAAPMLIVPVEALLQATNIGPAPPPTLTLPQSETVTMPVPVSVSSPMKALEAPPT